MDHSLSLENTMKWQDTKTVRTKEESPYIKLNSIRTNISTNDDNQPETSLLNRTMMKPP